MPSLPAAGLVSRKSRDVLMAREKANAEDEPRYRGSMPVAHNPSIPTFAAKLSTSSSLLSCWLLLMSG